MEVIPEGRRHIVCLNSEEPFFPLKEAIWAFDILRFLHDDLQLILSAGGENAHHIEKFACDMTVTGRLRFVESWRNLKEALAAATVAWITNRDEGNSLLVEKALAAGVPVLAVRCPAARKLIVDGVNGYLLPPGDKAALAKQTQRLLTDDELRRRVSNTARTAVVPA